MLGKKLKKMCSRQQKQCTQCPGDENRLCLRNGENVNQHGMWHTSLHCVCMCVCVELCVGKPIEAAEGSKPRPVEISSTRLTGIGRISLKPQILMTRSGCHLENAMPQSHKSGMEYLGALSKVFLSRIIVNYLVKMFDQFPYISPKSMRNPTESIFENSGFL